MEEATEDTRQESSDRDSEAPEDDGQSPGIETRSPAWWLESWGGVIKVRLAGL